MQRLQRENNGKKTLIVITEPKSECSIRTIPLPKPLCTIIKEIFRNQTGFLLTGSTTKYIEPRNMQNYYRKILKINAIKKGNFHMLRHTFATRCVEIGFDIKSLSEILGHSSINITMNRYVHPSMDLKRKNMDKLSELLAVK